MIPLPSVTDPPIIWALLNTYSGGTAFDIGANTGQAAKRIAPHFGAVHSFEPCLESFEVLCLDRPENVTPHLIAVSDLDGDVILTETAESIQSGQLTTGEGLNWGAWVGERVVPCSTLDTLVGQLGEPDFVKIDTEGHEVQVIAGGRLLWNTRRPPILIEIHQRANEQAIRALLRHYRIDRIEHEYLLDDPMGAHHFWLRCEPW